MGKLKKWLLIISLSIIILLGLSVAVFFLILGYYNPERKIYDLTHQNKSVLEEKQIYKILSGLEKVKSNELPPTYIFEGKLNQFPYNNMVKGRNFYKLTRKQAMQKIVGNYRIIDFISYDTRIGKPYFFKDTYLYWLVDPKVLVAFLRLKIEMEKKGLNWNKLYVTSGHRTPLQNKRAGGAPRSRHICGEAIDFQVGDVDGNMLIDGKDKLKVLEICEVIIGNQGGIGLYPGTPSVHIDTRGFRARWNSY